MPRWGSEEGNIPLTGTLNLYSTRSPNCNIPDRNEKSNNAGIMDRLGKVS